MIFKQKLSPQNGHYTPILCFHLGTYMLINNSFLILAHRDQFTCAYHCNKLDECTNFVDTLTTENCKTITDNGQGLVKTSKLNQDAVRVWSNQAVQKGL